MPSDSPDSSLSSVSLPQDVPVGASLPANGSAGRVSRSPGLSRDVSFPRSSLVTWGHNAAPDGVSPLACAVCELASQLRAHRVCQLRAARLLGSLFDVRSEFVNMGTITLLAAQLLSLFEVTPVLPHFAAGSLSTVQIRSCLRYVEACVAAICSPEAVHHVFGSELPPSTEDCSFWQGWLFLWFQ